MLMMMISLMRMLEVINSYYVYIIDDIDQSVPPYVMVYFNVSPSFWIYSFGVERVKSLQSRLIVTLFSLSTICVSCPKELRDQFEIHWDVLQWLDHLKPMRHWMLALCCRVKSKSRIDCERLCCWYSNIDEYSREKIPCIDSCSTVHKNTSLKKSHPTNFWARKELVEVCYVVECCSLCE